MHAGPVLCMHRTAGARMRAPEHPYFDFAAASTARTIPS